MKVRSIVIAVSLVAASLSFLAVPSAGSGLASGAKLWAVRYNGPGTGDDRSYAVAVSPDGTKTFVTGGSYGGSTTSYDYTTRAYSAATGAQLWTKRYNGPASKGDWANRIAVSADGTKVFVTGSSYGSGINPQDYATVAYNAATGAQLWVKRYAGVKDGPDAGDSLEVSGDGRTVFVTGQAWGGADPGQTAGDYGTIAYSAETGAQLWMKRYNGPASHGDTGRSLALSGDGKKVFVTGQSDGVSTGADYATVAYNASTGAQLWVKRYNGPGNGYDWAWSLAVNADATKVFITGWSYASPTNTADFATIGYNAATGAQLWLKRYNGPANAGDAAYSIAVSGDGAKVFVTGPSTGGSTTGGDYATIAYNAATGAQLWLARYNGPASGFDATRAVAVSPAGKVFVTGFSWGGLTTRDDYATVAYQG